MTFGKRAIEPTAGVVKAFLVDIEAGQIQRRWAESSVLGQHLRGMKIQAAPGFYGLCVTVCIYPAGELETWA